MGKVWRDILPVTYRSYMKPHITAKITYQVYDGANNTFFDCVGANLLTLAIYIRNNRNLPDTMPKFDINLIEREWYDLCEGLFINDYNEDFIQKYFQYFRHLEEYRFRLKDYNVDTDKIPFFLSENNLPITIEVDYERLYNTFSSQGPHSINLIGFEGNDRNIFYYMDPSKSSQVPLEVHIDDLDDARHKENKIFTVVPIGGGTTKRYDEIPKKPTIKAGEGLDFWFGNNPNKNNEVDNDQDTRKNKEAET